MPDCFPPNASATRSVCFVAGTRVFSSVSTSSASCSEVVTSTLAASGSCSAWLIRSAATCAASAVPSARIADLGRPRLGVDADDAAEHALGRGQVDVAGTGDDVDGSQLGAVGVGGAVGEQCDRLRAADRPHLVDAEQLGRGEDGRVRQPAERGLRRRAQHERADPGDLRWHHVHHHGRRVDREPARRVQADARHRNPALGDRAALGDGGGDVGAPLVGVHLAGAVDRLFECRADVGVQFGQCTGQLRRGHAYARGPHAVEPLGVVEYRFDPALADRVHHRPHLMQGGVHIDLRARQRGTQLGG